MTASLAMLPLPTYYSFKEFQDEWLALNTADVIHLAFAKALDTVPPEILLGKLIQIGVVQYTITED